MANPIEQRIVLFTGHVQGVGFRYTTCQVAGRFDVTGYVQNLPDGRVRCVAEGTRREIDAFLAALAERMEGYLRKTDQQTAPPSGQYPTFGVKY